MKQPEALRLAKELVSVHQGHADEGPSTFSEAAAELRRLYEANQSMLEALHWIDKRCPANFLLHDAPHKIHLEAAFDAGVCARASIAKGETK